MVIGFMTIAGLMTAHTVLETARDTLFLTKLPATAIPWNYLAIAFIAYFVAQGNAMLGRKFEHRKLLSLSAVLMSGITAGLWFLMKESADWMFYVLYIWTGLVATVLVVQFWVLMGSIVTVTQAKKIFGVVTAGGLVGAMSGSVIALAFLDYFTPRDLLLVSAFSLLLTSVGPLFFAKPKPNKKSVSKSLQKARFERSRPYLVRLVGLVFLSTVAFTIADFLFKLVLSSNYQGNELGQYLARFYLVVNFVALISQIFLTKRIMSRVGANFSIVVLPALMLIGAVGVAFGPQMIATAAIASLLFLKGSEGALKHSLHRTALEVLYFPLPKDVRDRFKAIIDVVGQRGGQA